MSQEKTRIARIVDRKVEDFVPPGTQLFEPDEKSREGRIVPEVVFTYGSRKHLAGGIIKVLPKMVSAMKNRSRGFRDLKRNPSASVAERHAEPEIFRELENFARSLGCESIGYTKVPHYLVFSNYKTLSENAIILTIAMDKKEMAQAPTIAAGREVWRTYDSLGLIVNKIAAFLRERGFAAQAGSPLGGEANYPRLAQRAGLGQIGKQGVLISPGLGPSQRIAAVYTSIENLPGTGKNAAAEENPHAWIADFCESCNRCVEKCPAGAIYKEKPLMEDGGPKHIDHIKCAMPFSKTMGCSVCIAECVFFKGDYEKIKAGFLIHEPTSCR